MLAKVTKEAVVAAMEKLKKEGAEPTPTAIHRITGGSRSTIYKILNQLGDDEMKAGLSIEERVYGNLINDAATKVAKILYDECWKKAEKMVIANYESKASREKQVLKLLDHLDMLESNYKDKEEMLMAKISQKEAEIAQRDAVIDKLMMECRLYRDQIIKLGGEDPAIPNEK